MSSTHGRLPFDGCGVGDGALATMLHRYGLDPALPPEVWNMERPDAVGAVHTAWRDTGAGWLQTNTFGATPSRLSERGIRVSARDMNRAAVALAQRAAGSTPVIGCLGPSLTAPGSWSDEFAAQAVALADAGVDGFLVESILALDEGLSALRACLEVSDLPVICTFSPAGDGRLMDGTDPAVAGRALFAGGAAMVGVNCGAGMTGLLAAAAALVALEEGPVLAAPSAGLPDALGEYPMGADAFGRAAIKFRELGVTHLAGCCGTTPDHLRAVRAAILEQPT